MFLFGSGYAGLGKQCSSRSRGIFEARKAPSSYPTFAILHRFRKFLTDCKLLGWWVWICFGDGGGWHGRPDHRPAGQHKYACPLGRGRYSLGRSASNELAFPEDYKLSREHLVFE